MRANRATCALAAMSGVWMACPEVPPAAPDPGAEAGRQLDGSRDDVLGFDLRQEAGCVPFTCQSLSAECGDVSDGCSGRLRCGSCGPLETCGAGGTPLRCGRDPWYGLGGSELGPWSRELPLADAAGGGLSATPGGQSGYPSLVVDGAGTPTVAWWDNSSGVDQIYLRSFDGVAWRELGLASASSGGVSHTDGISREPHLVRSRAGDLVVAWRDHSAGIAQIYARSFDGTAWAALGAGAVGGGVSDTAGWSGAPKLVEGSLGSIFVAWQDSTVGADEIYVRRWNGSSWVLASPNSASEGGVSDTVAASWTPALIVDASGRPVVAWRDEGGEVSQIYVRRLQGNDWVELGAGSASGGGISNSAAGAWYPALIADAQGGIVAAWQDRAAGAMQIYVRRFDGAAWGDLGAGSAAGGGVSASPGSSSVPSLALDATGRPAMAWQDSSAGNHEIWLRRFDGTAWVELPAGSASGGGISHSEAPSTSPCLASGGGRLCVAWTEGTLEGTEIALRCKEL